jgi:hypothetical protein
MSQPRHGLAAHIPLQLDETELDRIKPDQIKPDQTRSLGVGDLVKELLWAEVAAGSLRIDGGSRDKGQGSDGSVDVSMHGGCCCWANRETNVPPQKPGVHPAAATEGPVRQTACTKAGRASAPAPAYLASAPDCPLPPQ